MRIARIVDGVAVDFRIPSEFTPPEGETWVEAPDYVQRLSQYTNGVWSKPDGSAYTDEESQQTLEQLTLIERLSDAELVALEDICQPGHPARAIGLRIRVAMLAAVETYSRTERTKTFIGAAIQLGVVADIARARILLNDSGFSLG